MAVALRVTPIACRSFITEATALGWVISAGHPVTNMLIVHLRVLVISDHLPMPHVRDFVWRVRVLLRGLVLVSIVIGRARTSALPGVMARYRTAARFESGNRARHIRVPDDCQL